MIQCITECYISAIRDTETERSLKHRPVVGEHWHNHLETMALANWVITIHTHTHCYHNPTKEWYCLSLILWDLSSRPFFHPKCCFKACSGSSKVLVLLAQLAKQNWINTTTLVCWPSHYNMMCESHVVQGLNLACHLVNTKKDMGLESVIKKRSIQCGVLL